MRIPGHALTVEFSGERTRAERSSTGFCICGWMESHTTGAGVREEYRRHLMWIKANYVQRGARFPNPAAAIEFAERIPESIGAVNVRRKGRTVTYDVNTGFAHG